MTNCETSLAYAQTLYPRTEFIFPIPSVLHWVPLDGTTANSIKVGQLELGSGMIREGPVGRLVGDGQFGRVEPLAVLGDAVHRRPRVSVVSRA